MILKRKKKHIIYTLTHFKNKQPFLFKNTSPSNISVAGEWLAIVEKLCDDVFELCEQYHVRKYDIVHIQERSGKLDFYLNHNSDNMEFNSKLRSVIKCAIDNLS